MKIPSRSSRPAGAPAVADDIKTPKLKPSPKKIQISKKKAAKAATQRQDAPPEILETQSVKSSTSDALERQKTMIAELPTKEAKPAEKKSEKKKTFKFYCIRCGQKLEAFYDWVDKDITCPRCSVSIKIPPPLD